MSTSPPSVCAGFIRTGCPMFCPRAVIELYFCVHLRSHTDFAAIDPGPTWTPICGAVGKISFTPVEVYLFRSARGRHRRRRGGDEQSRDGECRGGGGRPDSREPPSGRGSGQSPHSVCLLVDVRPCHWCGSSLLRWVCLR